MTSLVSHSDCWFLPYTVQSSQNVCWLAPALLVYYTAAPGAYVPKLRAGRRGDRLLEIPLAIVNRVGGAPGLLPRMLAQQALGSQVTWILRVHVAVWKQEFHFTIPRLREVPRLPAETEPIVKQDVHFTIPPVLKVKNFPPGRCW